MWKDARLIAAERLSQDYWSKWKIEDEPILYHYTDAAGLCGILESLQLWLTSIPYLNDVTENQQAGVAARRALELVRQQPEQDRKARFYEHLDRVFQQAQTSPRLGIDKQTFVCCFSRKRDSLSQWRGYGGGEGGFSIGFKASALWTLKRTADLSPGYWLLPCEYNEDRAISLNRHFLQDALQECLLRSPSATDPDIAAVMARDAQWIGAAIKHPAFADEEEWRLIYYGFGVKSPAISYRTNSTLTPYIKFGFQTAQHLRDAISEVWVGPRRHPELAASALKDLLDSKLGGEVPVKVTGTPYRNL